MNRTIHYTVLPSEAGLRVAQFLHRRLYSRQSLAILRHTPGSTLRNGVPCRLLSCLQAEDTLTVHIQETRGGNLRPATLPLSILYEDEDLIVVNKPAGLPTHPSGKEAGLTLANALTGYYLEQGEGFTFRCCNRLDTDTSGVIPVAKHYVSAGILSALGSSKKVHRRYLALAEGEVTPKSGTLAWPLSREEGPLIRQRVDPAGLPAVTHYESLAFYPRKESPEPDPGYSLVSLVLETGRTHQIRVHMKALGFPLLGDALYHPAGDQLMHRQALHSWQMSFPHPITGEALRFEAPIPEDMKRLI